MFNKGFRLLKTGGFSNKVIIVCLAVGVLWGLSGCVVLPKKDYSEKLECGLSTDRKVLRVVNLTDGDTSFYRWSDELIAFITLPASAIVSGTYVLVNNVYHLGEKTIKCGAKTKPITDMQEQGANEPDQSEEITEQ